MPKNLALKTELVRWFSSQKRFKTRREMATALGVPHETLRKYFQGSAPGPENFRRLSEFTGLDLSSMHLVKEGSKPTESQRDRKQLLYGSRALDALEYELARSLAALAPL